MNVKRKNSAQLVLKKQPRFAQVPIVRKPYCWLKRKNNRKS